MRYRLTVLMLLFVLPVMYPFDAPAFDRPNAILDIGAPEHPWDIDRLKPPEPPYAILDIGPPPNGKTAEEHCKEQIDLLTKLPGGLLYKAWCDPEVQKLRLRESVRDSVKGKDIYPWLENNIRVTQEKSGRRLRFTFRAGDHAEQAVVINTLLGIYVRAYVKEAIANREKILRRCEQTESRDAKLIREESDPLARMRYQQQQAETKTRNAKFRDDIARLKQVAVMKRAE